MGLQLLVTDGNLVPVGDPISDWTAVDCTPVFRAAGSGMVSLPARPSILDQINADRARMVVILDDDVFTSGLIEKSGPFRRSADGTSADGGSGTVTVSFTDDLGSIVPELTFPDPSLAATSSSQPATKSWTGTNAETIMRALVNDNVGPGALVARRLPNLVLASPSGVGTSIDFSTRFKPLGDELRRAAIAGGNLGFTAQQQGSQIVFSVYAPTDVSGAVRFSWSLGNLRDVVYDPEAPTCTVAIVGGSGTGTGRTIVERVNAAAVARWGRIEQWVNASDSATVTEMEQAGDQALKDGGEKALLTIDAVDTADQRYGTAYGLGDTVAVEVWDGFVITDIVRAVHLTASPDAGVVISPLVGSDAATADSRLLDLYRQLERRTGRLETG